MSKDKQRAEGIEFESRNAEVGRKSKEKRTKRLGLRAEDKKIRRLEGGRVRSS